MPTSSYVLVVEIQQIAHVVENYKFSEQTQLLSAIYATLPRKIGDAATVVRLSLM